MGLQFLRVGASKKGVPKWDYFLKGSKMVTEKVLAFWGHMAGHYFTTLNYVYRNVVHNLQDYFLVANLNIQHKNSYIIFGGYAALCRLPR